MDRSIANWKTRTSLLALTLLAGCSSVKLQVSTAPDDARVVLHTVKGEKVVKKHDFKKGRARINFGEEIEFIDIVVSSDGYHEASARLSMNEVLVLQESGGYHTFDLPLTRQYHDVTQVVVGFDPSRGEFVARRRSVRAFEDVSEGNGVSVGRVYDEIGEGAGIRGLSISPDGRQLVFAHATPKKFRPGTAGPRANAVVQLEACNLRAIDLLDEAGNRIRSGVRHITNDNHIDVDPIFTPDGKSIRFASNRRRPRNADILQLNALGRDGGIQNIYVDRSDATALRPTMAANGAMVYALYSSIDQGRSEPVVRIWTSGGENAYETDLLPGTQPHVSPDGKSIVYIAPDRNIYKASINGTRATQMTFEAEDIVERYREKLSQAEARTFDPKSIMPYSYPSWSADGNLIVYSSLEGNDPTGRPNEDIWIMKATGAGGGIQLTQNGSSDASPVMDPLMEYIYFVSNRGGEWAIWSLPVKETIGRLQAGA